MTGKCGLALALVSLALAAAQSAACSPPFSSCDERRDCAGGGAGGALEVDAGDTPDAGTGGAAGAGDRSLFGACSNFGEVVCSGRAQAQRLACDGSRWLAGPNCASGELCDSNSGECARVIPECANASPGQRLCRGDQVLTCGVDWVTASEGETCVGGCKDGACQEPPCGDRKIEAGEACDAGMTSPEGGCGVDCKAICGDGVVETEFEQCDDANTVSGDGCSATCTWEPVGLSLGGAHTCALSASGVLKCWGENASGQLGLGDSRRRGDDPGEIAELPAVRLGSGRAAKEISSGRDSSCALLDDGRVKCWGLNSEGQLGLGDTTNRGDMPDQMGDKLGSVALIGNLAATSVSNGFRHACAVVAGAVQCWGSGAYGELGQGDTSSHPKPVSIFDFGKVSSVGLSAGGAFSCDLLQSGKVICWGDNRDGQLCYSSDPTASSVGDEPGEMSALFPVPFTDHTVSAIAAGIASVCALFRDASVRCWGRGDAGQLGTEDANPHGTIPYSIGSVMPIALGGRMPKAITSGARHVCVLLDDGSIKCWGNNDFGQLGIGNTVAVGSEPGTMGDNLKPVALGTGRTARQVVAGENHTCALLDDGTIKCWGRNSEGQLGLGDTVNRGVAANQMGDALRAVPLTF